MEEQICKLHMEQVRDLMDERQRGLERIVQERDKLFDERVRSQEKVLQTALSAVEKRTELALEAQKEASHKAELAQDRYNITHNDLLHRMDKQYDETLSRREYEIAHQTLREEIAVIRKELDKQSGIDEAKKSAINTAKWIIGLLVVLIGTLLAHMFFHS